MNCQFKRGIFRQRMCQLHASRTCSSCGTQVCTQHSVLEDGTAWCLNCYSEDRNLDESAAYDNYAYSNSHSGYHLWYWSMRSNYHNEYKDQAFDETDYSGFGDWGDEGHEYSDMEGDDFFDS